MSDILKLRAKIQTECWMIIPAWFQQISEALGLQSAKMLPPQNGALEPRSFFFDVPSEPAPTFERVGSVAVIPIKGAIVRDVTDDQRGYGFTGYNDVSDMLDDALNDGAVSSIVLDVDSPGGSAVGMIETAKGISEANQIKPIIAHTSGLMASAAYGLSAAATMVYATESATVGSVGTVLQFLDVSEAFNRAGLKIETIKSGDHKGVGAFGTTLTDEQRAALQEHVDELGAGFRGFITDHRPGVAQETMDGRIFTGATGKGLGLVDSVTSIREAIRDSATVAHQRK
jgi:signal peptide peptidase SppA